MSDARWIEVERSVASAVMHFGRAAELYDRAEFGLQGLAGYQAAMALQHAMQAAYTSLENALIRILGLLDEEAPSGPASHQDLIDRARRPIESGPHARPAILSAPVFEAVDEARRFRHRATHDYDNFDPKLAARSIDAARFLSTAIRGDLDAFRTKIDPGVDRDAGC